MEQRPGPLETLVSLPNPNFWRGKRVLLTGHTGFKGSWLTLWLTELGADVAGYALAPNTRPALFDALGLEHSIVSELGNLADRVALEASLHKAQPSVVIHMAAQPLVRAGYADPVGTHATNVMGTAHLLEAVRQTTSVRVAVIVTTDKVYHNDEQPHAYREDDRLGGHDPYSASKAAAEIVTASYRDAFLAQRGVRIATARAGNVIGGGDWSADRLIPDAVRAWRSAAELHVRRPDATRPWQHVLEPLAGYLRLAETLWENPGAASAFNFGPRADEVADVRTVVELARASYGAGRVTFDVEPEGAHEAGQLALDPEKARRELGIVPRWSLATTVERTMRWYAEFERGVPARALCLADLAHYSASA